MIAVIFEVMPKVAGKDEYFRIAAELKSDLIKIDGFMTIERFQSLNDPDKFLSLSFWKDETAVKQWRNHFLHQKAQVQGKNALFQDYRIRVAQVIRDYSMNERQQVSANLE
ncbi:antibiotic biosynthesis monooxygenase [uncultured Shewanella sp.]|uniref:antibiotic biosynthesis monooxygenase family protein n=1 Tax=uncultured Shewanella sp. TaxID=173975 RepID=UPI002607E211|nr:antibiotic biosynthesis monooxygenase [uncultured Shewanella sp.]